MEFNFDSRVLTDVTPVFKVGVLTDSQLSPFFWKKMNTFERNLRRACMRMAALKPDILCFDEPTSALDPELTGEVLKVIRGLADQETTMIIVTHEMAFARDVSSHVIFMDDGRIVEQGTPAEVFGDPKEARTKQFLSRYTQG